MYLPSIFPPACHPILLKMAQLFKDSTLSIPLSLSDDGNFLTISQENLENLEAFCGEQNTILQQLRGKAMSFAPVKEPVKHFAKPGRELTEYEKYEKELDKFIAEIGRTHLIQMLKRKVTIS